MPSQMIAKANLGATAPAPIPSKKLPSSISPSAAQTVYRLPEIRQNIFRQLAQKDLATCMRVEKGSMWDVARELYYSVTFTFVRKQMKNTTPRHRLYCSSVTEVDAHFEYFEFTKAMDKNLEAASKIYPAVDEIGREPKHWQEVNRYSPGLIDAIVPPLKKKLGNLRRVYFGGETEFNAYTPEFTVHLSPKCGLPGGHIELFQTYTVHYYALKYPRLFANQHLYPTEIPPSGYTIRQRDSLDCSNNLDSSLDPVQAWIDAFREFPAFGNLGPTLELRDCALALNDISNLTLRQITPAAERFTSISAEDLIPWTISDFTSFASVLTESLTCLILTDTYGRTYIPDRVALSFEDLPSLISTIRMSLPRLTTLHFAIKGIEAADALCRSNISTTGLEPGGTLTTLRIATEVHTGPILNIIRAVSPLCTAKVSLHIDRLEKPVRYSSDRQGPERREADKAEQTKFIRYLRRQIAQRRAYLSIIDFAACKIETHKDLLRLVYHDDGRLRINTDVKHLTWAAHARVLESGKPILTKGLGSSMSEFIVASQALQGLIQNIGEGGRLDPARDLLKAVQGIRQAIRVIPDDDLKKIETEVEAYIQELDAAEKMDKLMKVK